MSRLRADNAYLVLAAVFGLAFVVMTPPFQAPDEGNHFLRAYQLSRLDLIGEKRDGTSGGMVPSALYDESHFFDNVMFRRDVHVTAAAVVERLRDSARFGSPAMASMTFGAFPNTVRYSPVPYLPEIVAFWIARALGLTAITCLYLCRILGLAASVALTRIAIRLLPGALQWSLASLALLPMGLFMASIASSDSFLISLSFLTFSVAVWLRGHPDASPTAPGMLWTIAGCLAGVALSKLAYFLVPAAIAVGLFGRLPTTGRRIALLCAVLGVGLVLDLGWQALVEPIRTAPRQDPGLDAVAQFRLVAHDPMVFIRAVMFDASHRGLGYYESFIGKLGYLDVWLPRWVITSFTAIFLLLAVTRCRGDAMPRFTAGEKGLLLVIPVVTILLVMLLQYLDWVTVGGMDLRGSMQGRYFYPVAPALLVTTPRVPLPDRWAQYRPYVFALGYAVLLAATIATLVVRYY